MSRLLAWLQRHQLVLAIAALTYIPVIFPAPVMLGRIRKRTCISILAGSFETPVCSGTAMLRSERLRTKTSGISGRWGPSTGYSRHSVARLVRPADLARFAALAAAMGVRFLLLAFDWSGPGLGVAMALMG